MAKTAQDLVSLFRAVVDDTVAPYLWSDPEVLSYIDEAQIAFARGTEIFFDSTTPGLTSVPVAPKGPFVSIDPRIVQVRRAKLASQTHPLTLQNANKLDPSWDWEKAVGTPYMLVLDDTRNFGRLIPIPVVADTLNLWVYRGPVRSISALTDELEITDPEDLRLGLLNYMKGAAYDKNDSDIHNEALSTASFAKFHEYILVAKYRYSRQRRSSGFIRYGGL